MEHFNPYLDIPQVKELAEQVSCFIRTVASSALLIYEFVVAPSH